MKYDPELDAPITMSAASRILGVSRTTVYRLRRDGILRSWPVIPGSSEHRTTVRYCLAAREQLAATNSAPTHITQPTSKKGQPKRECFSSQEELIRNLFA